MTALPGIWIWVFMTLPTPTQLAPYAGAVVKATNGNGTTGDGFDFAGNYAHAVQLFGPSRCAAWTFLYPATTHGATAAQTLANAAPHAPAYIADIEDYRYQPGKSLPKAEIDAFFSKMHELRPGVPVGFTTYPTKAQAEQQLVNWTACIDACDFGGPQIYWPKQLEKWQTVVHDHTAKPFHAVFSPDDSGEAVVPVAQNALAKHGSVGIWAHPFIHPNSQHVVDQVLAAWHSGENAHVAIDLPVLDLSHADTATVRSPGIRLLQSLLVAAGLLTAAGVDGAAGPQTKAALLDFQTHHHIAADARVQQATWTALLAAT